MHHIVPEESSGIRWWLKKQRLLCLRTLPILAILTAVFAPLFLREFQSGLPFSDLVLMGGFSLVLLILAISLVKDFLRFCFPKFEQCQSGTVVSMRQATGKNRKGRTYYITADVNGKHIEGICLMRTYLKAEKGQKILLFTLQGSDRICCVHPDM